MTKHEIENATLEAIYWWNRNEDYYHSYFSKLIEIHKDKPLLEFFTGKVFEVFLREYSIRRNISSGYQNVDSFINELFEVGFIENVIKGDVSVIDTTSDILKKNNNSTNRKTISLLSKIAFLVNPNKFSLYDTLAKDSLWELNKSKKQFKKNELEKYIGFIEQTEKLREQANADLLFKQSYVILNEFKNTTAYHFFINNDSAFKLRIIDKYLWLIQQNSDGRKLVNREYVKFNKMSTS
ncbi:hypothetical protein GSB9_02050 [Flavobacteriaceae bacterium GSB9]|nr:hypothetical protein GSB9_02050 [Flavobacteriaceae bacterium GSB9]